MKILNKYIILIKKRKARYLYSILVLLFISWNTSSQEELDSLLVETSEKLKTPIQDSVQLFKDLHRAVSLSETKNSPEQLASSYKNLALWHMGNPTTDSTVFYLDKTANIYTKQELPLKLAEVYLMYENAYKLNTKYDLATQFAFKALEIYEAKENTSGIAEVFLRLSDLFSYKNDYKKGVEYAQKSIDLLDNTTEYEQIAKSYQYLAANELFDYKNEQALQNINTAIAILEKHNLKGLRLLSCRNTRGNILKYLERYDDAIADYTYNLQEASKINDIGLQIASNGNIGHVYSIKKEYKNAIPYLLRAIDLIKKSGNTVNLWENYMHISSAYENIGDYEKALEYERLLAEENKNYYKTIIARQEGELEVKYETAKKEETISRQGDTIDRQRKTQLLYIGLAVLFAALLLLSFLSLKNIRKKRKELGLLNEKLNESNIKLNNTISNLKSTQAQLIQSEKMASLGELTAGIAHEIQNPLNFVNNFSEISNELFTEMNEEIEKGDVKEAKLIALDIKQNLEKINHHGKRADAIVKGMLQHSRSSTGTKELTDINKLADEYLRLAYHGLRAKDKSFNATLETEFDESISKVNIIPQDMGRVILNLITNAFYAINEKKIANDDETYAPTVSISTKKLNDTIEISVKDNGYGIPKEILKKIYQPFFTTKPTGQGTGLGLSMSFDIVKSHGGEIKVETNKNKGTEFKIILPTT